MKRGSVILLSLVFIVLVSSCVSAIWWNPFSWGEEPMFNPEVACVEGQVVGDANGDGVIDGDDVQIIVDISQGEIEMPEDITCFDIDSDGNIDTVDVQGVGNMVLEQTILKLSSPTNAHGAIYNDAVYDIYIKYDEIFGEIYSGENPHECDGNNLVLTLSGETNAHGAVEGYSTDVCYGDLVCAKKSACLEGEELVVTLSGETNAHLAKENYPVKICCSTAEGRCENGIVEPGETCDAGMEDAFGGLTCENFDDFVAEIVCAGDDSDCVAAESELVCDDECQIDTSGCAGGVPGICGDGVVNAGETCDGEEFGEITCKSFDDFKSGELACTENCLIDTNGCSTEGVVEDEVEIRVEPIDAKLEVGRTPEWGYKVYLTLADGKEQEVTENVELESSDSEIAEIGEDNKAVGNAVGNVEISAGYQMGEEELNGVATLEIVEEGTNVLSHVDLEPEISELTIDGEQEYYVVAYNSDGIGEVVTENSVFEISDCIGEGENEGKDNGESDGEVKDGEDNSEETEGNGEDSGEDVVEEECSVASLENNKATGLETGKAVIKATYSEKFDEASLLVGKEIVPIECNYDNICQDGEDCTCQDCHGVQAYVCSQGQVCSYETDECADCVAGTTFNSETKKCSPKIFSIEITKPDSNLLLNDKRFLTYNQIDFEQESYNSEKDLTIKWDFGDGESKFNSNCLTTGNCNVEHFYENFGHYIISATANEQGGFEKRINYTDILIYSEGLNVFSIISKPSPGTVIASSEEVEFDASLSFVAMCYRDSDDCDAKSEQCYTVAGDVVGALYCYNFLEEDIGVSYDLLMEWKFIKGEDHIIELVGTWSEDYDDVVKFSRSFFVDGNYNVTLEVTVGKLVGGGTGDKTICQDWDCMIIAAENCDITYMNKTESLILLGLNITSTQIIELNSLPNEQCNYKTTYEKNVVKYSDEVVQQLLNEGKTQAEIDESEQVVIESGQEVEGESFNCDFSNNDLVAMLTRWKVGSASTSDWDVAECRGFGFDNPDYIS